MSGGINMQMSRQAVIDEIRNDDFVGPMIHLRDWAELQTLLHRAADLLEEAEVEEIVRALRPTPSPTHETGGRDD